MRTLRLLLLSFILVAAAPGDLAPYLVKDINPESLQASSTPHSFFTLGDLALFHVKKLDAQELWRSDGTASGTYRLATIHNDASTCILPDTGNLCFFFQYDHDHFRSYLWVTDGTLPGTFSLGWAGDPVSQWASEWAWVARQGILYFTYQTSGSSAFWRSDGTPGGTYQVPGWNFSQTSELTSFRGRLYFAAFDSDHGSALWRSDGTAQGTALVHEVEAYSLHAVGSRLIFLGRDDAHGWELWASDGTTAGTRRISDLAKGEDSPRFHDFKVVGKLLYFAATIGRTYDQELYVTDGTAQGTRRLTSFPEPQAFSSDELSGAALGDRLLFTADDGTHGNELWSTDGTVEGTRMVLDACPGDCPSYPSGFARHRDRLYYRATEGVYGYELWVTDGTAQGTRMVQDICPGSCNSSPELLPTPADRLFFTARSAAETPSRLWSTDGTADGTVPLSSADYPHGTAAGGALIFSGADPDHGLEPWISDGTPEGTHLLADVADEDVGGSDPYPLRSLGNSVLFFADDGDGAALWRSDGTEAGTRPLMGGNWTSSASRVFFRLSDGLWTSDGTEAGTYRVTPDGIRIGEVSAPANKTGSRFFFSADSPGVGDEPWITDGTRAGTRLVADLNPGPGSSSPRCLTVFRGKLWFGALSRLWKSDGTEDGTAVAFRPPRPSTNLYVCPFMTFGGRLLFTVDRTQSPLIELWATDGTVAGTERLDTSRQLSEAFVVHRGRLWYTRRDDLCSTDGTSKGTRFEVELHGDDPPYQMTSDGTRLYLWSSRTEYDPFDEIWVSDGTEDGTQMISDAGSYGTSAIWNGRLYFAAGPAGTLYKAGGTEAGTRPVRPDGEPDQVAYLVPFANRLVAFGHDGEVWQTDGTAGGTKRVRDELVAGGSFVKAGPRLFFPALDPETGWELWAIHE